MTKRLALAVAALAASALALGQPAAAQSKSVTLGTASTGGTYFVYGGVVASLLTNKIPGLTVSTQQTQGPNQNIVLVSEKKVELGMTTMGIAFHAWEGTQDGWTKGKKYDQLRALFPMYDTPFHFVTLKRTGITKVADLKGKTVGVGPRAGTCGTYFPLMFKALKVDLTIQYGQASDMASRLSDGLIAAFPFCAGIPIAAYSELDASRDVTFFTYTDAEIAELKKAIPELSDSLIPKGTYKSQTEDHKTVGVYNFFIVHKDFDADMAYQITRAVLENNAEMVKGHAAAKETVIANWDKNTFLPFHPGAVRYYAEKGIKVPDKLIGK
jgi:TRAP transporter TAXI family solute receptor